MKRSPLPLFAAATLVLAACGGGSSESSPTTSEPVVSTTTDAPTDFASTDAESPLDDTDGDSSDSATSTVSPSRDGESDTLEAQPSSEDGEDGDEIAPTDGESVEACLGDDCDGVDDADEPIEGGDIIDEPDFVPDPGDAAFCSVIDEIGDADLPGDDQADAQAIQGQIAQLLEVAPDDILDDLMIFAEFIGRVAAGQATLDDGDDDPIVQEAGENIGDAVFARCSGFGEPVTGDDPPEVPPVDPVVIPDDPPLPNGVVIPFITVDGEGRDENTPFFGERNDEGGPAAPEPGFSPTETDAGFCTALDIINSRPQPRDDFQEIIVAQQYLVAIDPLVPNAIRSEFVTLLDWVDELVEAGTFDGVEEPGDGNDLDVAIDAIDAYVNVNCLGR